ncbi:MAG: hypothetical protein IT290_01725, partial [Deltaproteobacteria bacterium]|nr:hypothetical protein [Deltaproteobacteria bacterium]
MEFSREVVDAAAEFRAVVLVTYRQLLQDYNRAHAALDISEGQDIGEVIERFHVQTEELMRLMRGLHIAETVLNSRRDQLVSWLAVASPTLVEGAGSDPELALELLRQEFCPNYGSGLSY